MSSRINAVWREGVASARRRRIPSGLAREEGSAIVDGREAVRIGFDGSKSIYIVDAATFEPIELRDVGDDGTVVTSRFETYELLPATPANLALLSLRKQHPGAAVRQGVTVEGFGPDPAKRN